MRAYFDSGFLFKLYWPEPNSLAALSLLQRYSAPVPLPRFNEVEMLHVARRKTWVRGANGLPQLTSAQLQAGLALFEQGFQTGILTRLELDYDEVFDAALELSRQHGQTIPIKTADLMHVAMMGFGFDHFVTADKQQHDSALRIGLTSFFLPP